MIHGYRYLYSRYKTENIYVDIAKNVERRINTSNYEL